MKGKVVNLGIEIISKLDSYSLMTESAEKLHNNWNPNSIKFTSKEISIWRQGPDILLLELGINLGMT